MDDEFYYNLNKELFEIEDQYKMSTQDYMELFENAKNDTSEPQLTVKHSKLKSDTFNSTNTIDLCVIPDDNTREVIVTKSMKEMLDLTKKLDDRDMRINMIVKENKQLKRYIKYLDSKNNRRYENLLNEIEKEKEEYEKIRDENENKWENRFETISCKLDSVLEKLVLLDNPNSNPSPNPNSNPNPNPNRHTRPSKKKRQRMKMKRKQGNYNFPPYI